MPSVSSQEGIHINKAQICPTSELLALSVTWEKCIKIPASHRFSLSVAGGNVVLLPWQHSWFCGQG